MTLEEMFDAEPGVWHYAPHGFEVEIVDLTPANKRLVHLKLTAAQARRLKARGDEVVEAFVNGRSVDLVPLKSPKAKRTRTSSSR